MNVFKSVMEAVMRSTEVKSNQQLVDTVTTANNINLQQGVITYYAGKCKDATAEVTRLANLLAKNPDGEDGDKGKYKDLLVAAQAKCQEAVTINDQRTKQVDGMTQAMQNQTGQDSYMMQQVMQLIASVNTVMQSLTTLLQK
jgi:hypothetical protein